MWKCTFIQTVLSEEGGAAVDTSEIRGVFRYRWSHFAIVVLLFWWAFAFRFATPDFRNDHFDHLSKAQQVLSGDLPGRDFYDDGRPLTIYVSAALQRLSPTLLPELALGATALALGVVFVYLLARAISGWTIFGVGAAFLTMAMRPRLYNYPKALLFPVGLWLLWRYIDRPTGARLAQLAMLTAVAFLFRHDYGVYLALAVMGALVVLHRGRKAIQPLVLYVSIGLAGTAPYLIWLAAEGRLISAGSEGLVWVAARMPGVIRTPVHLDLSRGLMHIAPMTADIGIRWATDVTTERRQAIERTFGLELFPESSDGRSARYRMSYPSRSLVRKLLSEPAIEDTAGIHRELGELVDTRWRRWQAAMPLLRLELANIFPTAVDAQAWIYYVFLLSTPLASLVLWVSHARRVEHETVKLLSLVLMCAVLHQFLILSERGADLETRLADVAGPTVILLAWLMSRAIARLRRGDGVAVWVMRTAVASVLITLTLFTWLGVAIYADTSFGSAASAGFTSLATLGSVARDIHRPPLDHWAGEDTGKAALARYVARCLAPDDRLLTIAYVPEVFYLSGRRFAGGTNSFIPNGFNPTDQGILERLQRQSVPIVVIDENYRQSFERGWPGLARYLASRYREVGVTGFGESEYRFEILMDTGRTPARMDSHWSLPCFSDS